MPLLMTMSALQLLEILDAPVPVVAGVLLEHLPEASPHPHPHPSP